MQPTNTLPGFFQSPIQVNTNSRTVIDTPLDPNWSKPNQQYKEYQLSQNINITKSTKNYAYAMLRGIQEVSTFSKLYFSYENIQEIQKLIKYNVLKEGGFKIDDQSEQEILIVMRAVYLEFSNIPEKLQEYTDEIIKLNKIVIDRCIRIILSEITQQQKYIYDIANLPYRKSYGVDTTENITGKNLRDVSSVIFAQNTNFI